MEWQFPDHRGFLTIVPIMLLLGTIAGLSGVGLFVIDTTGDGLTVGEELFHYDTNPLTSDTSGNGLTDYEEVKIYHTDPHKKDTLGNGLTDYEEVHIYGTDPMKEDTLGNGLTDYEEVHIYGTDPMKEDTLGNGLTDYDEIYEYGTDPTKVDTLGNGLTDYDEIYEYGTDPMKEDTLGNGLTDYEEVRIYGTDPMKEDTLGNGLTDHDEIHVYGTDPMKEDTLGNGLTDYDELYVYGTDPLKEDTSGDGLSDAVSIVGPELYPDVLGDVDPLQKDIVLELNHMEGTTYSKDKMAEIKSAFATSPVENPDGTTGINLHIIYDGEVASEPITTMQDYEANQYHEEFDTKGYGTRHILIAQDVYAGSQNATGVTYVNWDGMLVQHQPPRHATETTLMHELGHSLGLHPNDHPGIDSVVYSVEEYPSVMNYNHYKRCYTDTEERENCVGVDEPYVFSDGTAGENDFNDWAVIEEEMSESADTSEIEDEVDEYLNSD